METKDLIIETAFLAFIDNGYDRVSLNTIIKSTGLTKGAFYHNFTSKNELIHEVMAKYFFAHINRTINLIDGSGDNFEDKLVKTYSNIMNVDVKLYAYPDKEINEEAFMRLFQQCMEIDAELRDMAAKQQLITISAMSKAIDEAKSNDEVRDDIDSLNLAELINVTIRGTMVVASYLSRRETELMLKKNMKSLLAMVRV